jgi:hypothetical protein
MTKIFATALLASLSLASFAGCATDSDDMSTAEISADPVSGMVGGQAWTFKAGDTDAFLSSDGDTFFASLYSSQFTTCGFSEPTGDHLILNIPKTVGDYPMSLSRNMTFVVGNDNKIAIDGHISVTEVTATQIKGGIASKFDDQNTINGSFTIPICPDHN